MVSEWSHCTYDDRQEIFERNLDHCLKNVPETLHAIAEEESTCGNYFVEPGKCCLLQKMLHDKY